MGNELAYCSQIYKCLLIQAAIDTTELAMYCDTAVAYVRLPLFEERLQGEMSNQRQVPSTVDNVPKQTSCAHDESNADTKSTSHEGPTLQFRVYVVL